MNQPDEIPIQDNQSIQGSPIGSHLSLVPNATKWGRQPNESIEAFTAFSNYLNLKAKGKGSLRQVAEKLSKSETLMKRWSVRWNWVGRYKAWENHQILLAEAEQKKAYAEQAKVVAKRKFEVRDSDFEAGTELAKRAMALLKLPVYDKQVKKSFIFTGTITDADGVQRQVVNERIETLTILNFNESPKDARLYLDTASKLKRQSLDMRLDGDGKKPVDDDFDFDNAEVEDLEAYAQHLIQTRQKEIEAASK